MFVSDMDAEELKALTSHTMPISMIVVWLIAILPIVSAIVALAAAY